MNDDVGGSTVQTKTGRAHDGPQGSRRQHRVERLARGKRKGTRRTSRGGRLHEMERLLREKSKGVPLNKEGLEDGLVPGVADRAVAAELAEVAPQLILLAVGALGSLRASQQVGFG